MSTKGILYGVGVGPGDPMLLTLKADDVIYKADIIAYISNNKGYSLAKSIAQLSINKKPKDSFIELSIPLVMSLDRIEINKMYDRASDKISQFVEQGKRVVFLCEGDPLFFGSFAYLLSRLADLCQVEVVPGICSIHAAAAACKTPLGLLTENIAIFSGRHSNTEISLALKTMDNVVILKAGRARNELIQLINDAGRAKNACYIEYASQAEQKVFNDISQLDDSAGPYFCLFLVNACRDSN